MDMETRTADKALVLTLGGRLDAVTAPEFERKATELIAATPGALIVDFARLDYISSAGLRALLATAKRIKAAGGQMLCAGVTGPVKEVFDISGFSAVFQMHDSVVSALAAVG
jgi:stage II sporulation protein AA (anti-sigma F factor antagonist)